MAVDAELCGRQAAQIRARQAAPRSPDNNDALVFEKRKLPEVLDLLAARYRVPIRFDRARISGLYFTGTVLKTDSLLTILQVITNMNELEVVEDNNGYIIQKPIP